MLFNLLDGMQAHLKQLHVPELSDLLEVVPLLLPVGNVLDQLVVDVPLVPPLKLFTESIHPSESDVSHLFGCLLEVLLVLLAVGSLDELLVVEQVCRPSLAIQSVQLIHQELDEELDLVGLRQDDVHIVDLEVQGEALPAHEWVLVAC